MGTSRQKLVAWLRAAARSRSSLGHRNACGQGWPARAPVGCTMAGRSGTGPAPGSARRWGGRPWLARTCLFTVVALAGSLCLPATAGAGSARASSLAGQQPPGPAGLTVESLRDPVGLGVSDPRFGWLLQDAGRGVVESAYQIQVARSAQALAAGHGDVWDSGHVESGASTQVGYAGPALASATRYYWHVRVWAGPGGPSGWSATAFFETGLLSPQDWTGSDWIATDGYARTGFTLPAAAVSARLYVSARGDYEYPPGGGVCCSESYGLARGIAVASVNGRAAGDRVLDPAPTDTRVRALYSTYDVTALLQPGANALGVQVGEPSDIRAVLLIWLADGQQLRVTSDPSWDTHPGPVTLANRYNGENYDARLELAGWDTPGYDTTGWAPASLAADDPTGTEGMAAGDLEPIRAVGTLTPASITTNGPGDYVVDFGRDIAGVTRLTVSGPAGATVTIHHGEMLDAAGHVTTANIAAAQTDQYTLKGSGTETWSPQFVYHGFRYAEVTGYPGTFTAASLTAVEEHTDVTGTGQFTSSDPRLNQLQEAIHQTQLNALHGLPEDSPTREKRGWMADAHLTADEAIDNFGMAAFDTNFVQDMADEQQPSGLVPDFVPAEPGFYATSDTAWGAGAVLMPWTLYQRYGDVTVLRDHYDMMRRWVDYVGNYSTTGYIVDHPSQSWGEDWLGVETTPGPLFRTGFYYLGARTVAQTAALLGNQDDAARYNGLASQIATVLNANFLNHPASGGAYYGNDSQYSNAFPLYLGIVPASDIPSVLQHLEDDVAAQHGHFAGGFLGVKYTALALSGYDQADLIYQALTKTDQPSLLYMVDNGPGTIWESYDGTASRDHPALGAVGAWLYEGLAGLQPDPAGPGYRRSVIAPQIPTGLSNVSAHIATPYGTLASSWERTGSGLTLAVTVPDNTTSTVTVPTLGLGDVTITEGGSTVWANGHAGQGDSGLSPLGPRGAGVAFTAGSGQYTFAVTGTPPAN